MFVIDASVVMAWCLQDESRDLAAGAIRRLFLEGGIAPGHWPIEVANALRAAERRGRLDRDAVHELQPRLVGLPVEIVPVELSTALGSMEIASRYELSVHDAVYL